MKVEAKNLKDDGIFPNNSELPLLLYQHGVKLPERDGAAYFEKLFKRNSWGGSWRNGIYGYHHYHSTAHEVLGVYGGRARVQLGGGKGVLVEVGPGDVVIIPAGVAHKNIKSSSDFRVVGAYPKGQTWDMNYGKAGERPTADRNIEKVPLPVADPVFGRNGPLALHWVRHR